MKKLFALALAFVMVMGSVPAVMAEDAPVTDNTADVQKEEYIKDLIGMADGGNDEASLLSEYADILKQKIRTPWNIHRTADHIFIT